MRRLTIELPTGADARLLQERVADVGATWSWRTVVVHLPDEPERAEVDKRVRDAIRELHLSPESIAYDEWIESEGGWSSEVPTEARSWVGTLIGRLVEGLLEAWP